MLQSNNIKGIRNPNILQLIDTIIQNNLTKKRYPGEIFFLLYLVSCVTISPLYQKILIFNDNFMQANCLITEHTK